MFLVAALLVIAFSLGFMIARSRYRHVHAVESLSGPRDRAFYDSANARLPSDNKRIVFAGDSLVEQWPLLCNPHLVNRGLGGDTTGGLVDRFEDDVIGLRPHVVVLLVGVNDLRQDLPAEGVERNFITMCESASRRGISVVLISLLPTSNEVLNVKLVDLNAWLRRYAEGHHHQYIDLHDMLITEDGHLNPEYTWDGIHLTGAGYRRIEPLVCERLLPL